MRTEDSVHTSEDVLQAVMAGANVAMMATELMANGVGRIRVILDETRQWMDEYEYESVAQMRGSMSQRCEGAGPADGRDREEVDV